MDRPLLELVAALKRAGYRFVTPTPETHRRVLARDEAPAEDMRGALGWNRPFAAELLGDRFEALRAAGLVEPAGDLWRSRVRVSSLGGDLFVHSAFPTEDEDSVFFGPDSYRFARLIRQALGGRRFGRAVDFGAGAGVGAISLARCAEVGELILTDVNPRALALARVNARAAGVKARFQATPDLAPLDGGLDLVIANPPFIAGTGKTYSDGGGAAGAAAALAWARAAAGKLSADGMLLLYTGAPIVDGRDAVRDGLAALSEELDLAFDYDEIDPDIFGEELERPAYREVERIAAVSAVLARRSSSRAPASMPVMA